MSTTVIVHSEHQGTLRHQGALRRHGRRQSQKHQSTHMHSSICWFAGMQPKLATFRQGGAGRAQSAAVTGLNLPKQLQQQLQQQPQQQLQQKQRCLLCCPAALAPSHQGCSSP